MEKELQLKLTELAKKLKNNYDYGTIAYNIGGEILRLCYSKDLLIELLDTREKIQGLVSDDIDDKLLELTSSLATILDVDMNSICE